MNKTFEIKGMTCGHCEGRVTSEILTIPGVTEVIASAEKANVIVESDAEISHESIEHAVQRAGYSVTKQIKLAESIRYLDLPESEKPKFNLAKVTPVYRSVPAHFDLNKSTLTSRHAISQVAF